MKIYSVKIGIFKIGFELGGLNLTPRLQHKIKVWVTMEGWKFRAWKRRIRACKPRMGADKEVRDGNR